MNKRNGPIAMYEFEDGSTYNLYTLGQQPKGLKKDGKRPVKLYTSDVLTNNNTLMHTSVLASALSDDSLSNITSLYTSSGKYLLKNGVPVELQKHKGADTLYIPLDSGYMQIYEEAYDGTALSEDLVRDMYPEYFI